MLNYIKAELYKVSRRKYPYVFLLFMLLGEAVLLGSVVFVNSQGYKNSFETAASELLMLLMLGLYAAIMVCDMVFSDQYKCNTLKNEVSFGIPRVRIYLGKLISAAITAIILMCMIVGVFLGVSFLVTLPSENTSEILQSVGICLLTALPAWLGSLAVTMTLFTLIRSNVGAAFGAVGILGLLPAGLKMTCLLTGQEIYAKLANFCLSAPFDHLDGTWASCGQAWMIGMGWAIVAVVLGVVLLQRKEIN